MQNQLELSAEQFAWAEALKRAAGFSTAQRFETPFAPYANDLPRFGREVLGHRYWRAQEAVMRRVLEKRRVAYRKCRKTGGTFAAADLALGFLMTRPSIVLTTAQTHQAVREVMWSKIRVAHSRARTKLPGELGVQSLRIEPDWYALGLATDDPENLLGFHAGVEPPPDDPEPRSPIEGEGEKQAGSGGSYGSHGSDGSTGIPIDPLDVFNRVFALVQEARQPLDLLVIFDEAVKIKQPIFDAMEGSLSGDHAYALIQSNPRMRVDEEHTFARAFRESSGWWRMHASLESVEGDTVGADERFDDVPAWLKDVEWIEKRRHEWTEASPLFQSDVLGRFSTGEMDRQMIPGWVLEQAASREIPDDGRVESRHIGADVAASENAGRDWCVASLWICGVLAAEHKWKSGDTMTTVGMILQLAAAWGVGGKSIPGQNIHIDGTGLGKGIVDRLRQTGHRVDGVDFGSKARYDWKHITGEMKFRNRKTELYWTLRRALQEGVASIPKKYGEVWKQLQWHTYPDPGDARLRGRESDIMVAETKDELRKLFGRSPDNADAAVLAWSRSGIMPTIRIAGSAGEIRRA